MGNLFITELTIPLVWIRLVIFLDAIVHLADYRKKKLKMFVTENKESEAFCMEGYSEKYTIVVGNSLLREN